MTDYRIDIKVRNNILLKKIEDLGHSVMSFSNEYKITHTRVYDFVNMTRSPLGWDGNFLEIVIKIAEILKCSPEDLFTERQMTAHIESNKRTLKVKEAELAFYLESKNQSLLLEEILDKEDLEKDLEFVLKGLTPRMKDILEMRFGLNGYEPHTLEKIGEKHGLDKERIRQLEAKALRMLRHPSKADLLKEYL